MRNNGEGHRNKHFSSQENDVLPQFDQGFKGTILNRALLSLPGGSLKITLKDYNTVLCSDDSIVFAKKNFLFRLLYDAYQEGYIILRMVRLL